MVYPIQCAVPSESKVSELHKMIEDKYAAANGAYVVSIAILDRWLLILFFYTTFFLLLSVLLPPPRPCSLSSEERKQPHPFSVCPEGAAAHFRPVRASTKHTHVVVSSSSSSSSSIPTTVRTRRTIVVKSVANGDGYDQDTSVSCGMVFRDADEVVASCDKGELPQGVPSDRMVPTVCHTSRRIGCASSRVPTC